MSGPGRPRSYVVRAAAVALWLLMALQVIGGMRLLSTTHDETTHLPSGYVYWTTGEFRLNAQHPPLVKLLCAAPLLLLDPVMDPRDPFLMQDPPAEWEFGYRFLYTNEARRLLFWGRLPAAMLGLLLAAYVWRWAREMFGAEAGLVALALCAFSPTIVAHARLVTFDVGLACFTTMTFYHLWRHLRGGGTPHLVACGLALGLALATKYSGLVTAAAVALTLGLSVVLPLRSGTGDTTGRRLGRAVLKLAAQTNLVYVVVQASYFFSADPWIYGRGLTRVQADHAADYAYYLMGEFRPGGFWYYFIVAFLIKTPVPTLILLATSLVLYRRTRADSAIDDLCLVVPAVLFFVATSAMADNMGVRYLMPVYPLLFVFVSRLAPLATRTRATRAAALVLGLWYAGAALWIYPDNLSYFNELIGGPSRGHLYLDDSNIDWGQDLARLGTWMKEHDVPSVYLRYGPWDHPETWGVRWLPVSDGAWAGDPPPGLYAIGTHLLIRGELFAREQGVKTDWLSRYEPVDRVGYSIYLFRFE